MELSIIDKKLAMDSRDIAKLTNKQHSHVLRDIKNMLEKIDKDKTKNGSSYNIMTYKNINNVTATYYLLDYELTLLLLTGYSVELRAAVVKRWLYLEKHYQTERKKSIEVRNTFFILVLSLTPCVVLDIFFAASNFQFSHLLCGVKNRSYDYYKNKII